MAGWAGAAVSDEKCMAAHETNVALPTSALTSRHLSTALADNPPTRSGSVDAPRVVCQILTLQLWRWEAEALLKERHAQAQALGEACDGLTQTFLQLSAQSGLSGGRK